MIIRQPRGVCGLKFSECCCKYPPRLFMSAITVYSWNRLLCHAGSLPGGLQGWTYCLHGLPIKEAWCSTKLFKLMKENHSFNSEQFHTWISSSQLHVSITKHLTKDRFYHTSCFSFVYQVAKATSCWSLTADQQPRSQRHKRNTANARPNQDCALAARVESFQNNMGHR